MPDNGAGTFTVLNPPFTANTVISSSETNGNNTDFATGLTNRLTKDGDTDPTANLPMAGFKHTGATATSGVNAGEYVARDLYNALRYIDNAIENPSGEVNQRGTTNTTDDIYGGPDRWYTLVQTGAIAVSQGTNGEDGTPFYERLTQSQASAQRMGRAQIVLSANCRQLRGAAIVLQARVRQSTSANLRYAILEWTGTADSVTSDVVNNWTSGTYTAGNFFVSTTTNVLAVGSTALTANTWADITIATATCGSSMNNLIVFFWTEATVAQNVTLDLAKRKLAPGAVQTPFYPRAIEVELAQCVFYFERYQPSTNTGYFPGSQQVTSATASSGQLLYSTKRTTPAVTFTAANTFILIEGDGTSQNPSVISASNLETYVCNIACTLSGAATGAGLLARDGTDTAYIEINAEM